MAGTFIVRALPSPDTAQCILEVLLSEGANDFVVCFEEVAARECPYAMALQLVDPSPEAFVFVPTSNERVARRQVVEDAIESAYLDRDVFVWDDPITVCWPKSAYPLPS